MKRSAEHLVEEISDFLVVYLKSGKVGLNSFIKKANLNISQVEHLLQIHFLLKEEVKNYVRELPVLIRRFKTSTNVEQSTLHGQVRGQIDWKSTIQERNKRNAKDKTIFTVNQRNREYSIKENLVLREFLEKMDFILFGKNDIKRYMGFSWFQEWKELKTVIYQMVHKNIYLSRVEDAVVTDRMILDTMKHRNRLYRTAAELLFQYRRIMAGKLEEAEIRQLLRETFVFPEKEDVLFELYWVVQLIKQNTEHAQLELMNGKNNLVARWSDERFLYMLYHDSGGSANIKFQVSTEEIREHSHPYLNRKLAAADRADSLAQKLFGKEYERTLYWSGRPDIIVEVYDKESKVLKKIVLGEVKHTNSVEYAITGLRELIDYVQLIKDKSGSYFDEQEEVEINGMLFTDKVSEKEAGEVNLDLDEQIEEVVHVTL